MVWNWKRHVEKMSVIIQERGQDSEIGWHDQWWLWGNIRFFADTVAVEICSYLGEEGKEKSMKMKGLGLIFVCAEQDIIWDHYA